MAQEEKRVIIHFDTLEGFQARLTDGTLTEKGDYIVLIKDSALIWVKGQFFTGPSVLSIPKYIKDCEIIQESGKPLTLKFVGAEWNTEEKIYKEFNKTIELTLASTQSDGLMSKEDKAKVDKILTTGAGTKFLGDDGKYYPIELTIEAASDNIKLWCQTHKTSTNADEVDSHTINAATTSKAGVMSATDKAKLDSAGKAKALASATSGQWIRFAELAGSMYNSAIVTVKEGTAGATFFLKKALNKAPVVKILDLSDNIYLTKIRVCTVLNGDSTGFLDVYVNTDSRNMSFNVGTSIDINLVEPSINGSTEGYNIEEVSLI